MSWLHIWENPAIDIQRRLQAASGEINRLRHEVLKEQAKLKRVAYLNSAMQEPDLHFESLRDYQREMTSILDAASKA